MVIGLSYYSNHYAPRIPTPLYAPPPFATIESLSRYNQLINMPFLIEKLIAKFDRKHLFADIINVNFLKQET